MANAFTPEQIAQILEEFFKTVGTRQYIGARYVPIFGRKDEESIEWDNTKPYEPLTIVLYLGNSYTSRQYVPAGVQITNEEFWAITGNYNAQIEEYRRETARALQVAEGAQQAASNAQGDIDALLPKSEFSAQATVYDFINKATGNIKNLILLDGDPTGETDCTSILQAAIDNHKVVVIPNGEFLIAGTVRISNECALIGYGSNSKLHVTGEITTNGTPNTLYINKVHFVVDKASGNGVSIVNTNSVVADPNLIVTDCIFTVNTSIESNANALYLMGVREAIISDCIFEGSTLAKKNVCGIAASADSAHLTMNIGIVNCVFAYLNRGCDFATTINNRIYLAGFRFVSCTVIGCDYGIKTNVFDTLTIIGCMVDYCTNPIHLGSTLNVTIKDCYIQSPDGESCIYIENTESTGADDNIVICDNNMHSSNGNVDPQNNTVNGITLVGKASPQIIRHVIISNNTMFRLKSAIDVTKCQFVQIHDNVTYYCLTFLDMNTDSNYVTSKNNYVQIDVPNVFANQSDTFVNDGLQYGDRYSGLVQTGTQAFSVEAGASQTYTITFPKRYWGVPAASAHFNALGDTWKNIYITVTNVTISTMTVKVVNNDSVAHSNTFTWNAIG